MVDSVARSVASIGDQAASVADVEEFLRIDQEKELLRFTTAGSVDDGKSTLIGRLLFDTRSAYEDQIASLQNDKLNRSTGPLDFSLLTDGLRAEREQGITIDVAYRYFATTRRKFIIADTPGHVQYTRNMATGASTADLAVTLVDARNGMLNQSRRHMHIAGLLGIPNIIVAVNKMDLVGYSQEVFDRICCEASEFSTKLGFRFNLEFVPISALEGDNVVYRSSRMGWFEGGTLLEALESVPVSRWRCPDKLRYPVQHVIRPNPDFRGFAGQIASGRVRRNDPVVILPSGRATRVKAITTFDGDLDEAAAPMSVTLTLEDEVDVSRGDMLVTPQQLPIISRHVEAMLVWLHDSPLKLNHPYIAKHTTQMVRANVRSIRYKLDVDTFDRSTPHTLELNDIACAVIDMNHPIFFDAYGENRGTGSFILIDPIQNLTVGAGMLLGRLQETVSSTDGVKTALQGRASSGIGPVERYIRNGHHPATIWLDHSRLNVAYRIERRLFDRGCAVHVLSDAEESRLVREMSRLLYSTGTITICAVAYDGPAEKERARSHAGPDRFIEVDCSSLAVDDDEAAAQVCRYLEDKGIFRA